MIEGRKDKGKRKGKEACQGTRAPDVSGAYGSGEMKKGRRKRKERRESRRKSGRKMVRK